MACRRAGTWTRWALPAVVVLASALAGVSAERSAPSKAVRERDRLSSRETALVELGRRLFHDPAASALGAHSCAACHDPEHGFSDRRVLSNDDFGPTPRHSQTLIDVDTSMPMHWDGGAGDLEAVGRKRTTELSGEGYYGGMSALRASLAEPDAERLALEADLGQTALIQRTGVFAPADQAAFPGPDRVHVRYANVLAKGDAAADCARALAAYVKTLRSNTSAYDRFVAGEKEALSASAQRGLALFEGRAGCVECHRIEGPGDWPAFRDGRYHNTGVSWLARPARQLAKVQEDLRAGRPESPILVGGFGANTNGDPGRQAFDRNPGFERAFKTPTLRDVARHPPYMHDGSLATLADVVRHYASGCGDDPGRTRRAHGFEASETDVADLVSFLEALTSERRPGLADKAWARRATSTALQFVDATGTPMAGLEVTLTPAGEPAYENAGTLAPFVRTTDARGKTDFRATPNTHVCVSLPRGLPVTGGGWLPDSCREATLVVPVSGTARIALVLPKTWDPPATLNLWRVTGSPVATLRTAARKVVRSAGGLSVVAGEAQLVTPVNPSPWLFELQGVVGLGTNRVALYDGWCPFDGREMLFRLPDQKVPQGITLEPNETVRVELRR